MRLVGGGINGPCSELDRDRDRDLVIVIVIEKHTWLLLSLLVLLFVICDCWESVVRCSSLQRSKGFASGFYHVLTKRSSILYSSTIIYLPSLA